jgi:hypothetical protein
MSALGRPASHRLVAYLTPERATIPTRAASATPRPERRPDGPEIPGVCSDAEAGRAHRIAGRSRRSGGSRAPVQ